MPTWPLQSWTDRLSDQAIRIPTMEPTGLSTRVSTAKRSTDRGENRIEATPQRGDRSDDRYGDQKRNQPILDRRNAFLVAGEFFRCLNETTHLDALRTKAAGQGDVTSRRRGRHPCLPVAAFRERSGNRPRAVRRAGIDGILVSGMTLQR